MKGILGDECSMSNITSASNEASISSSNNRNEIAALYNLQQQHSTSSFASPSVDQTQTPKRKRNLPGNPDPEAEVIALSPTTLMTKNRFMCEICNKGFQRDQNLQLHRRGHNLPWKLKQRANKEVVKKKVYVCPEATCVHHDPSRALGDLTGIKKHFFRKHGEKKWKCEKCSKRYAVQSDWKAHSKICGTREYRCDCGTLFSRRDSFITHRAFCDALAEESSRSIINQNPQLLLSSQTAAATSSLLNHHLQPQMFHGSSHISFPFKREPDHHPQTSTFNLIRSDIPPWLASCPQGPGPGPPNIDHQVLQPSSQLFFSNSSSNATLQLDDQNPNPNLNNQGAAVLPSFPSTAASPHMSATALLQKAAQMGATMSKPSDTDHHNSMLILRPHQTHMFTPTTAGSSAALGLSSHEAAGLGASFGNNNKVIVTSGCMEHVGATTTATHHHQQQQQQHFGASSPNSLLLLHHDNSNNNSNNMNMMMSSSSTSGFGGSNFEEPFNGMLMNNKRDAHFQETRETHLGSGGGGGGGGGGGKDQGGDSMTRDFLGLRAFPHRDFIDMASLNQMNSSSLYDQHTTQDQSPWQG